MFYCDRSMHHQVNTEYCSVIPYIVLRSYVLGKFECCNMMYFCMFHIVKLKLVCAFIELSLTKRFCSVPAFFFFFFLICDFI